MKIARFKYDDEVFYGEVKSDRLAIIEGDIFSDFRVSNKEVKISEVEILQPVVSKKIIAVGLNYSDHAEEFKFEVPEEPVIFLVSETALIGDKEDIVLPNMTGRVDYEGELVIVIKKACENISPEEAEEYILGYTCGNDVTNRRLQKIDGQWTRAKSFNTFKPIGPHLVTDLDVSNLEIKTEVNGEVRQKSNTKNLVFDCNYLVSFVSKIMPLKEADLIFTGTPSGVSRIYEGDSVKVSIENIGSLENKVKKEK